MKTPLVSIITINYNQTEITIEFLQSITQITYQNVEIFVVDNGSKDDSIKKIEELFPSVNLIISKENLGFSGGNNLAIEKAKGDFILLINNDTEVEKKFLEPLVETFELDPKIGAVSPKIKYFDSPTIIQYAGYNPMNPLTLRCTARGKKEIDKGLYDEVEETHFAHGAAIMVSSKVIEHVGKMPLEYFLYYEELAWCKQIKKAGFKIYYNPHSVVLHKESMSIGKSSPMKTFYMTRNRILFARLNLSLKERLISSAFLIFISIPKNTLALLPKFSLLTAYWKGIIWHLKPKHKKYLKYN